VIKRAQALKISRLVIGLCVGAALIYFLYSKSSPPGVSTLITLAAVLFFILRRRSGAFDKNPYFRRLALVSSRKPIRDFGMALICFVAMMAATIAIAVGVKHNVLPDNYVTAGIIIAVIVAGIVGILFFISGVIGRVFYGPPRP
jgi:hypothetical protein